MARLGGGADWQFRLDYIFHGPQMRTLASRVIATHGSDHFLLASTLEWAGGEAPR